MKRILLGTASALLLSAAAAAQPTDAPATPAAETPAAPEPRAAELAVDIAVDGEVDDAVELSVSDAGLMRGSALLGLQIENEQTLNARVDDIVVTQGGAIDFVVVNEGGFFGVGGEDAALMARDIYFVRDDVGELHAATDYTEDELDMLADAAIGRNLTARPGPQADFEGWSLRALIDASVDVADADNAASIDNVLFDADGQMQFVLLRVDGLTALDGAVGVGGRIVAVAFDDVAWAETEEGFDIDVAIDSHTLEGLPEVTLIEG